MYDIIALLTQAENQSVNWRFNTSYFGGLGQVTDEAKKNKKRE